MTPADGMQRPLGRTIKAVIAHFPGTAAVLSLQGIGCAECALVSSARHGEIWVSRAEQDAMHASVS